MPLFRTVLCAVVLAGLALPGRSAGAQTTSLSGLLDARWDHGFGDGPFGETFTAGLRARALFGGRLAYCAGAEARAGVASGDAAYAAEAYLLGVAWRPAPGWHLALCAGAGASGITGGRLPRAWTLPVELSFESESAFGVVRPLLWARAAAVAGAGARRDGSPLLPLGDELRAGAGLRVTIPSRPAPDLLTADGLWIGVTYAELLGQRSLGLSLGLGAYAAN